MHLRIPLIVIMICTAVTLGSPAGFAKAKYPAGTLMHAVEVIEALDRMERCREMASVLLHTDWHEFEKLFGTVYDSHRICDKFIAEVL